MRTKYLFFLVNVAFYPLLIYVIVPYIHSLQDFRTGTDPAGGGMASGFAFVYECIFGSILTLILSVLIGHAWLRLWWMGLPALALGLLTIWGVEGIRDYREENRLVDYEEYYDSGELKETGYKRRGTEKHGKVTEYYNDGTVMSVQTYKKGVRKGPYQGFYPDGKLKAKGRTDNITCYDEEDRMDGNWSFYREDGTLDDERGYRKGELLRSKNYTLFYDTARLIRTIQDRRLYTGTLKKTGIVGPAFFPNLNDGEVVEGHREGPHAEFFTVGGRLTPATTITYKDYKPDGDFRQYHENGQLAKACRFIDGELEGEYWKYYADSLPTRPAGQVEFRGFYKDGEANGMFLWYYENGQLDQECTYVDGKRQGISRWCNEDGSLYKISEWKDDERVRETFYDKEGKQIEQP